jgi:hypothetical protein
MSLRIARIGFLVASGSFALCADLSNTVESVAKFGALSLVFALLLIAALHVGEGT